MDATTIAPHCTGIMVADRMATLARTLAGIFAEKTIVDYRRPVAPYHRLAPGVHLGFEPTGTVEIETRPKDDFTRSPDACLDTLVVDYRKPSRWLTIEAEFGWPELAGAQQFHVGVYARPDRTVTCRVALRIPAGGEAREDFEDVVLCELALAPDRRSAHGRGRLGLPPRPEPPSRPPKLLVFFDARDDLHLPLDYLTAYFA
jgi:hypothetical protein